MQDFSGVYWSVVERVRLGSERVRDWRGKSRAGVVSDVGLGYAPKSRRVWQ